MIVKDLFDFVYPDIEKRNLLLSLMTKVECDDRHIRLYHGYENPKNVSLLDFNKVVKNGYYLYFKYAHFDDEIFYRYDSIAKVDTDYENENIHKKPCLIMSKKILKVEDNNIEEIKSDKWKEV